MKHTKRIDVDGAALGTYVATLAWEEYADAFGETRPARIGWCVYAVISTDIDGTCPRFRRRGATRYDDMTADLADAEPVAEGTTDWDGEAQFTVDAMVGDARDLRALLDALKRTYVACAELTGRDALDGCVAAEWATKEAP